MRRMGISTDAIHGGQAPDPTTGAVIPPIYQTSTYVQEELGKHKGFEYARTHNATRQAWERCVATLERGHDAIAFASGLSAIAAILHLFRSGDHVIAPDDMYGGTYRLFERVFRKHGFDFTYVDMSDAKNVEAAARPNTKLVFAETPSNPLMKVTDLSAVAGICRERHWRLAVDNTFLTPYFQRPLELGADLSLHSTTKYLNGHSDMVGGVIVARDAELGDELRFLQNAVGMVPGPMDCWLALRGVKTLAVRMPRHAENAAQVAEWLRARPEVEVVHYPGFKDHPGHAVSIKQSDGHGGMVSCRLASLDAANRVARATRLFALAESLGGVESLVCHPASMTHASVPRAEREQKGFTDGLLRFSVGIEDVADLIEDLEQAFRQLR